ncbi:MAG: hypothetical protein M9954_04130 [Cyclobacteriaceae bacterium]|nr:hypothetical protein [Cyclobacteriaceae bacterium]MCB9237118.1 hypothetical protein [Flammeovirgaceae bacterium]MCB0500154.1 hypothetical protein [Cyclobacteriaceae bacterium]MCO5270827.1 hypothetical protein [Cyclobacteriaceae bacterium]MCW5901887.1 hypothetical protein [Cyclobacteriaceae bacterium]
MRIAIVTNSLAGNGRAAALSQRIKSILDKANVSSRVFMETEWGTAIYGFDQVWLVGGDGTLNYFVNQFKDIKKPLCLFDGGTGNDFYALLYGKATLEGQVQMTLRSAPKPIDAGKCNDRLFMNGVGVGFEGAVVKSLLGIKKFSGKTSFLIHIIKYIFLYREPVFSIRCRGRAWEGQYLMISIANGKRYGGGFYVAPLANPNDGLLDTVLVSKLPVWKRLWFLPVIEKGKHLSLPFIDHHQVDKITLSGKEGLVQAHIDGEYLESRELVIEVLPSHFNFIY